jgi:hypothetical protein
MKLKKIFFLLSFILISFLFAFDLKAGGFGITPPRIWNEYLVPGSHFEQTITLTRSEPDNGIQIETQTDAPDIKGWIKIKEGEKFIYPADSKQFPMTVIIDVPTDAGYGNYYGKINIKAIPVGSTGQVTVALGAVVDLKLRVSGEEFSDFKIQGINIPDIEEKWPLKVLVTLQNLGNIKVRPSRVHLDIFDDYHEQNLKSADITSMTWVDSFKTGSSEGELSISLSPGQYWADYEIYKNDVLTAKDKIRFYVKLEGSIVPLPLLERIKRFIMASPLRLVLFTALATLILVISILGIVKIIKKRKNNKKGKTFK